MYSLVSYFFFFNDTATTEIYPLSLHDALPISSAAPTRRAARWMLSPSGMPQGYERPPGGLPLRAHELAVEAERSEEHTSELQSQSNLVCRLLLEKKKKKTEISNSNYIVQQYEI